MGWFQLSYDEHVACVVSVMTFTFHTDSPITFLLLLTLHQF